MAGVGDCLNRQPYCMFYFYWTLLAIMMAIALTSIKTDQARPQKVSGLTVSLILGLFVSLLVGLISPLEPEW